jgi:peptide deformylase
MEPLTISKFPDAILRKDSIGLKEITDREKELFEKMLFTMDYFCGIGLAAPQIGISKKLIVAEVEDQIVKLANPEIVVAKGHDNMAEGCLSVPDTRVEIERYTEITVKGLDEKGEAIEMEAIGLLARVLQHEIDHLNGKLIIDYTRSMK